MFDWVKSFVDVNEMEYLEVSVLIFENFEEMFEYLVGSILDLFDISDVCIFER